jgi:transmembrane sensor
LDAFRTKKKKPEMSLSIAPSEKAKAEAAAWFARLKKRDVPAADMEAFRLWRKEPGNKEAYDAVDAFWRRSESLKADPDIQDAIVAARGQVSRVSPRRLPGAALGFGLAFALALLAIGGVGLFRTWGPETYTTRVGEQRLVRLTDGSTVMLDTASKIVVRYGKGRRDLDLKQGQAMFDVAHDATRPFVVRAGDTSVTALGTRFDVRRDDGGAQVTLVRGSVEVSSQGGATPTVWRLSPGQALSTTAPAPRPAPVDIATKTSWTTGRLVFNDVPLAAAVAEINRYDKTQIVLDVGPLDPARISGTFDVGDTDYFVSSAAELNDFVVSRSEPGVIHLSRGPQPPTSH